MIHIAKVSFWWPVISLHVQCPCILQEAITKSLAEYNEHINALKDDMQEATESAEEIRAQIQEFRKK